MNAQPSVILTFQELCHESPRWRNLLLMAVVCTVLAVLFQPKGGGGPTNSYTPPGQSLGGPVAPPKAGMAQPLNVVAPAAPPPIRIKPSQSLDGIEVRPQPQPQGGTNFGQAPGGQRGGTTPSQSVDEIGVWPQPQPQGGTNFGQAPAGWKGGIKPSKSLDEIEVRPQPQPQGGTNFGQAPAGWKGGIKPSQSLDEIEARPRPQTQGRATLGR